MREPADAPLALALDDGTIEQALGVVDQNQVTGSQAVFLNRFTLAPEQLPFTLDTVTIAFPTSTEAGPTRIIPGSNFEVLVYVDPGSTGDPANATLKFRQPFAVQPSNSTFQEIQIGLPIVIQFGDVWVGFTNTVTATDGKAIFPAALDTGTVRARSWAFFNRGVGNHFDGNGSLSSADVGQTVAGNWLIRAVGQTGGATCVRWDPPGGSLIQGGLPPPTNTRRCDAVPPASAEAPERPHDVLMGYNVYRSNQPGVQPTPANLFTSVPPSQTNVGSSVSPNGSFFVITAMYDTGESGPSDEFAVVPPTVSGIKVNLKKVDARGTNFTTSAQVFLDGIPFRDPAVVKSNGNRVVQKGLLLTGETVGQYFAAHNNRVRIDIRNNVGAFVQLIVQK
jgi:hypothetical protein